MSEIIQLTFSVDYSLQAYIYDLRQNTPLHKLSGHSDIVSSVAFHPTKPQVLSHQFTLVSTNLIAYSFLRLPWTARCMYTKHQFEPRMSFKQMWVKEYVCLHRRQRSTVFKPSLVEQLISPLVLFAFRGWFWLHLKYVTNYFRMALRGN